jgi:hypothetical protein
VEQYSLHVPSLHILANVVILFSKAHTERCPTEHESTAKFRHYEKLNVPGKQHGLSNLKKNSEYR